MVNNSSPKKKDEKATKNKIKVPYWYGYEDRELGCLLQMWKAFSYVLSQTEPLSIEIANAIHKTAVEGVRREMHCNEGFDTEACYNLVYNQNLSLQGYLELQEKAAYASTFAPLVWCCGGEFFEVTPIRDANKENVLKTIIQEYNAAQTSVPEKNREQQLKNIILLASSYARLHPRADGNNRTATIILNGELIKHGFRPAILENPNRLEGFSQAELLQEVYQGMRNFIHVEIRECYPGGQTTLQLQEEIPACFEKLRNIPDILGAQFTLFQNDCSQLSEVSAAGIEARTFPKQRNR